MNANSEAYMATISTYKSSAIDATKSLLRNWIIIPGTILAYFLFLFSAQAFSNFGFLGGFIIGLVHICLLSLFYLWLAEATEKKGKLNWGDLAQFDPQMFFNTLGVAFIYFIVLWLVHSLFSENLPWLFTSIQLTIFLVFNPVAEVIYVHRFDGSHALSHSAEFIKLNWIEWFVPLLIMMLPVIYLNADSAVLILANTELLLPAIAIVNVWNTFGQVAGYALSIFGILVAIWFMLFRGFLFKNLDTSSRRQRVYNWRQSKEND